MAQTSSWLVYILQVLCYAIIMILCNVAYLCECTWNGGMIQLVSLVISWMWLFCLALHFFKEDLKRQAISYQKSDILTLRLDNVCTIINGYACRSPWNRFTPTLIIPCRHAAKPKAVMVACVGIGFLYYVRSCDICVSCIYLLFPLTFFFSFENMASAVCE
jgi:hypothetical protein